MIAGLRESGAACCTHIRSHLLSEHGGKSAGHTVQQQQLIALDEALHSPHCHAVIMLCTSPPTDNEIAIIDQSHKPVIWIGADENPHIHSISINHAAACEQLVNELVAHGHHHITYFHFTAFDDSPVFQQRLNGYRHAIKHHGLAEHTLCIDRRNIRHFCSDPQFMLHRLKKDSELPSALICCTQQSMLNIGINLARAHLHIPHDISGACFGNNKHDPQFDSIGISSWTHVQEPWEQMGISAGRLLANCFEYGLQPIQHIRLHYRFTPGDSVRTLK